MAINIRSIGANQGIISVSLSASVTDSPAKLSVTTLANGQIAAGGGAFEPSFDSNAQVLNFNGIQFAGSLVAYNRHYEQGKGLITYQYIDNSTYLDQNSIILFRRGLPSRTVTVGKTLRITRLRISAGSGGVSFNLVSTDEYYAVERFEGVGAGGLGREKFTTNPCDQSDVDYDPNEALNIIGAPNISGIGRVSYEGSYRTILSSIYNDAGAYYWWDWRYSDAQTALKKFNGSISIPEENLPTEGCGIISADKGWTKEGTYTLSSWVFQRDKTYEAVDGSASTVVHDSFDVSPIPHPNYPTAFDILFDTIPAYRTAYAVWGGNFSLVGLRSYGTIGIPGAPSGEDKEILYYKYNFNFNKSLRQNILEYLGVGEGGAFYLVKDLENIQKPPRNFELFYPYSALNDINRFGSLGEGSLKIKRVEYNPATTRRGLNPLSGTWEDQVGLVRLGLWRSVSTWIEGNPDSSNFDEAVQDCFVGVSHDIFCSLYDNKNGYTWINLGGGQEAQVIAPGSLRDLIENQGYRIVYVRYPKSSLQPLMGIGNGQLRNLNDTPDLIGYVDPNAISNEDKEKQLEEIAENDKEFNNPCKSVIKDFDDDSSYDDTDSAPEPGLLSDQGPSNICSCGGQAVLFVYPSLSSYRVVRRTSAQYSKTLTTGSTKPSNTWRKSGGISSEALSHTVNITDITPNETDVGEEIFTPEAGGSATALKTFSATCDGFYLPIVPTLESLTATVDSAGLLVSYSYKDIPFKPKLQRNLVSAVRTNVSNTMS